MVRRFFLSLLVFLQVCAVLSAAASASTVVDAQHRGLHAVLADHHHDDLTSHAHDPMDASVAGAEADSSCGDTTANCATDHHHHPDANVSVALLPQHHKPTIAGLSVQNPSILPTMHSAEQRADLRPPQA